MTLDRASLAAMLAEDDHGLLTPEATATPISSDDRLIASFEQINDFVDTHGRPPELNRADIGEWQLAKRLASISLNEDHIIQLEPLDRHSILTPTPERSIAQLTAASPDNLDDIDRLLLGHTTPTTGGDSLESDGSIFELRHVPAAKAATPELVAHRTPCADFDSFAPLFDACVADLRTGRRKQVPFRNPSFIEAGKFFVLRGTLVYVAAVGELTAAAPGKDRDARTRCIYANGTESNVLLRSLGRGLYDDGRTVTEATHTTAGSLFAVDTDADLGCVYVLRSLSTDPALASFADLHKIGSTKQTLDTRIAGAETDPTFLSAPVKPVASYTMSARLVSKVETILHHFFEDVRLDIWVEHPDRDRDVMEWFDVPAQVINEAVTLIEHDTIAGFAYDPDSRSIVLVP